MEYQGKEGQEGEIRTWGGIKYQKEGGKWKKIVEAKGDYTYNQSSKFEPKFLPPAFKSLLPKEFFDTLEKIPSIVFTKNREYNSYYSITNKVYMSGNRDSYSQSIYIHELGHYYHTNKKIVTDKEIRTDFKNISNLIKHEYNTLPPHTRDFFEKLKKHGMKETGKFGKNVKMLKNSYPQIEGILDKFTIVCDIVEGLTEGKSGCGHGTRYWQSLKALNGFEQELFAHGMQIHFQKNELFEKFFPKTHQQLEHFFNKEFNQDKKQKYNG